MPSWVRILLSWMPKGAVQHGLLTAVSGQFPSRLLGYWLKTGSQSRTPGWVLYYQRALWGNSTMTCWPSRRSNLGGLRAHHFTADIGMRGIFWSSNTWRCRELTSMLEFSRLALNCSGRGKATFWAAYSQFQSTLIWISQLCQTRSSPQATSSRGK